MASSCIKTNHLRLWCLIFDMRQTIKFHILALLSGCAVAPGKRFVLPLAVLFFTGCALTPTQNKAAGITAAVLIIGAIAAHDTDHGKPAGISLNDPSLPCRPQPDGACR